MVDTTQDEAEHTLMAELRKLVEAPAFRSSVVASDQAGRMALDNVNDLKRIGITALPLSSDFGADGPSVAFMTEVMKLLGQHDPSTAVALNMHWVGARTLSRLPSFPRRDEALAAIAAGQATICGAFSNPSAELDSRKARLSCVVDGDDLVLNGKAGFGSMSDAASYAMLGGMVEGGDPSNPTMMMTVGRLGEPGLIRHQNWSAMGMRGTGSNDIECNNLRVPREDCLLVPVGEIRRGRVRDSAVVAFGITAIWVGMAQAAFDFTLDHVQHRYGYMAEGSFNPTTPKFRADEAWAQVALGRMDHWIGTGRDLLRLTAERLDAEEEPLTRDLVRNLYHLRRMAEEVAMDAMKVCGAHGYVTVQPLERIFRDMIGGVVMAWKTDQLQQTLGLGALGREIAFTGPAGS